MWVMMGLFMRVMERWEVCYMYDRWRVMESVMRQHLVAGETFNMAVMGVH